jgi:hypothetical protein
MENIKHIIRYGNKRDYAIYCDSCKNQIKIDTAYYIVMNWVDEQKFYCPDCAAQHLANIMNDAHICNYSNIRD